MNPRQGPLARTHQIRETSWGEDPVAPTAYLLPVMADNFAHRQPRTRGVFFDGIASSKGSFREKIDASGGHDLSLDFDAVGLSLMNTLGSTGYTRVGTLHRWVGMGNPLPYQIRKEFTQAPAIVHRFPGVVTRSLRFSQAISGQTAFTEDRLGKGSRSLADIASTALTDDTTKRVNSYFNGSLEHDAVTLANAAAFELMIDRKVVGKDGLFQNGELAAYSIGIPEVSGDLGKIFSTDDGDAFYELAVDEMPTSIVCIWANAPFAAGPTMFLRVILPRVLFDAVDAAAGGETIPDQTQPFIAELPDATVFYPAHALGTVAFAADAAITLGASVVASVKFQGGPTIDVTLTTGDTLDEISADLNADPTFNHATNGGTAYNVGGHLEIRSHNTTSASSVQWQTATPNSAHAILGFDTTTWTEYAPAEIYAELFNAKSADYA